MTKLGAVTVAALLLAASSASGQQQPSDGGAVHEVRTGDTLWDLAEQYLGNPFRWPEIHSINRPTVPDPDLIFPREQILIPGRRQSTAAADSRSSGPAREEPARTVFFSGPAAQAEPGMTVVGAQTIRGAAIPAGTFHSAGILTPDSLFSRIGELVSVVSPTVVERNAAPQIQPFDRVNVVVTQDVSVGTRLQFVRPAQLMGAYGRVFLPTGSGVVLASVGRIATIEVDRFYERVALGDLVTTLPVLPPRDPAPRRAAETPTGRLIGFAESQPVAATDDVGFVNLGSSSGVVQGDEFVAYVPATERAWGREPEVEVATLQVIRADLEVSTVRVVSLEQPALDAGMPVRLVVRSVE